MKRWIKNYVILVKVPAVVAWQEYKKGEKSLFLVIVVWSLFLPIWTIATFITTIATAIIGFNSNQFAEDIEEVIKNSKTV